MKAFLTFITTLILFTSAYGGPQSPCESLARSKAMQMYKSEADGIQGSDPILESRLLGTFGTQFDFEIVVSDQNDEDEHWSVFYFVRTNKDPNCKVLTAVKTKTQ